MIDLSTNEFLLSALIYAETILISFAFGYYACYYQINKKKEKIK